MTRTIILNSTTTCSSCKVVAKRLTAAKIPFTKIDLGLPEHAEQLAELKRSLNTDIVSVPIIQYGARLEQIDGLADIINTYQEANRG